MNLNAYTLSDLYAHDKLYKKYMKKCIRDNNKLFIFLKTSSYVETHGTFSFDK